MSAPSANAAVAALSPIMVPALTTCDRLVVSDVSLRQAGVPGPPLAAKKLPPGPFPLSFTLTEADRPMANGPVPDELEVQVTLDADGDPMSKTAGDLEGIVPATKGAASVSVALAPRR